MVGMPPYRYLISLRIARAAHLLRESDLTVTQILHRVGFHSPSHFTTTFRRHMGMSPTDYRRRADFEQNANRFSRATDPLVHQPEVSFMHECRRLQCVVRALAGKMARGDAAQFSIDIRKQFVERIAISRLSATEQFGKLFGFFSAGQIHILARF